MADTAISQWLGLKAALAPVVGESGFNALYQRCLAYQGKDDSLLQAAHHDGSGTDDFAALHAALSRRPAREAAVFQQALMRDFHRLLV